MRVVCPHCLAVNNVPFKESYKKANCGKCKQSLLNNIPVELDSSNFDEVLVNSEIPVIVDFWAPWCGPCQMMAPTFKEVANHFPLTVLFAKVNTQDEPQLASRFGIRGIPTLAIFKNGIEIQRVSGALDSTNLVNFIQSNI